MSGHSKWSTIKRKKGIQDQKRGQVFTKLSRLITLAVAEGGGLADPERNVRLRLAVARAKAENMPKENIQRAIERASGPDAASLKEVVYEGFGPGGASLIIVAATDNSNRTHTEVKNTLEKRGGKMGASGSVLYMFEKCGAAVFKKESIDEEKVFELSEKLSAIDVEEEEDSYIMYVPFEQVGHIKTEEGSISDTIDIFYRPKTTVTLEESERASTENLMEALEDLDDVDKVYTNYE